jgi:hypothetical protein
MGVVQNRLVVLLVRAAVLAGFPCTVSLLDRDDLSDTDPQVVITILLTE